MTDTLFPLPSEEARAEAERAAPPRVQRPNRAQLEWRPVDLESLLPADHRARIVWAFVEGLDLAALYAKIRAVEGRAGRPAIDPQILMALWLYATVEGVGSARAIERLCEQHDAYRWIAGGVSVNHHTLADFRVAHVEVLHQVLTASVATLLAEGLVQLTRVAQDGMRVRASAGSSSTTPGTQVIVGVAATNVGSDRGELVPMVEQLNERYGQRPGEMLVDGGFASHDAIEQVTARGCTVYAPVPKPKDATRDRYEAGPGDSAAVAAWRARMARVEAQTMYKDRAATAECVNALARQRGLQQFSVRGLTKVTAVLLWFALAHNLMRSMVLRSTAVPA